MTEKVHLLNANDLAALLQISVRTVRKMAKDGTGPKCLRVGRQIRWEQQAVDEWITKLSNSNSARNE